MASFSLCEPPRYNTLSKLECLTCFSIHCIKSCTLSLSQGLWVFVTLLHTFALHSSTLTLAFGLKNFNGFGIWAVDCACLLREGFNKKNDGYQTPSPGTSTHWTDFLASLSIQVSPPSSSKRTTSSPDIVL